MRIGNDAALPCGGRRADRGDLDGAHPPWLSGEQRSPRGGAERLSTMASTQQRWADAGFAGDDEPNCPKQIALEL
jgi:hypothetical protein